MIGWLAHHWHGFSACSFGGAPFRFIFALIPMEVQYLCLDALFFHCVLLCFFGLSVLHFRGTMCSGPCQLNFAWGSLDVYSVALDFCVPVFMSHLDGLDSTGVSQVS